MSDILIIYKTTDGMEFDSLVKANNHQDLIDHANEEVVFNLKVSVNFNIREIAEDCQDYIEDNLSDGEKLFPYNDCKQDIDNMIIETIEDNINGFIDIEDIQAYDPHYKQTIEKLKEKVLKRLFEDKVLQ